jgi:hypothetical protein
VNYVENGKVYKYLIAFIDNLSRYIIHWAFLENKTSELTMRELEICIGKVTKFAVLHTDNGREFAG